MAVSMKRSISEKLSLSKDNLLKARKHEEPEVQEERRELLVRLLEIVDGSNIMLTRLLRYGVYSPGQCHDIAKMVNGEKPVPLNIVGQASYLLILHKRRVDIRKIMFKTSGIPDIKTPN